MQMHILKSSMITCAGFDESTGTLALRFSSGKEYHHTGVPKAKFDGLMAAPSAGKFYNEHVRGKHPFTVREKKP
jgi:hypothetical protein